MMKICLKVVYRPGCNRFRAFYRLQVRIILKYNLRRIGLIVLFQPGWKYFKGFKVSNGHSPQIRQNGKLLMQMCRGESHFSQKSLLANVGECIESD
jgi:hypothetical protein